MIDLAVLAPLATGRTTSLFADDLEARRDVIRDRLRGARVLVIGGGGTIGGATARAVAAFEPAALHLVDVSENNLVEVVRDLRGARALASSTDLSTWPLDYGSPIFHRFMLSQPPYDFVMNFAAVKHVRSEKDVFALLQMLDTNIVKQARLLGWLAARSPNAHYFSVSTDKAANPVNLMGATKRLMEHVMFSTEVRPPMAGRTTSARFANVAFSDGSLLFGWLHRLTKRQPIPVPAATRRFFISIREAGELCVLAGITGEDGTLCIPALDPRDDLCELLPIAHAFVEAHGLRGREYTDEHEAITAVERDLSRGSYPILVTPLDTSGEKAYEEFVGDGEVACDIGLTQIQSVRYVSAPPGTVRHVVALAARAIADPDHVTGKAEFVQALTQAIPRFAHVETGKSLDARL